MLNYKEYLAQEIDFTAPRLVLVEGGFNPATGLSWCPECIEAEENVKTILIPFASGKNLPLDIVEMGEIASWKDPLHPMRNHSVLKFTRLPTLIYTKENKSVRSLVEFDILNKELLVAFLEDL